MVTYHNPLLHGATQNESKSVTSLNKVVNTFKTSHVLPDHIFRVIFMNECLIDNCHLKNMF